MLMCKAAKFNIGGQLFYQVFVAMDFIWFTVQIMHSIPAFSDKGVTV